MRLNLLKFLIISLFIFYPAHKSFSQTQQYKLWLIPPGVDAFNQGLFCLYMWDGSRDIKSPLEKFTLAQLKTAYAFSWVAAMGAFREAGKDLHHESNKDYEILLDAIYRSSVGPMNFVYHNAVFYSDQFIGAAVKRMINTDLFDFIRPSVFRDFTIVAKSLGHRDLKCPVRGHQELLNYLTTDNM